MATLTVPYSFVNATAIVASEMNSNFGAVKTFVEGISSGINIDTGAIDSTKLATTTVQLLTPTGSVVLYGGNSAPTGWLLCNGALISRTTYASLFAVIGTTYGVGDGTTTFALPNFAGRVPAGVAGIVSEPFYTNGETGGSRTSTAPHTHSLASHTHSLQNHTHSGTTGDDAPDHTHSLAFTTSASGSFNLAQQLNSVQLSYSASTGGASTRHQHSFTTGAPSNNTSGTPSDNTSGASSAGTSNGNLQPYLTVNFIIKT